MNVFDLVTELILMFEMNAKNDISNVYNIFKHFVIFEIIDYYSKFIREKIANYQIRLICCSKVQKMSKGSDYLFLLYVFLVIDCLFFP